MASKTDVSADEMTDREEEQARKRLYDGTADDA